MFGLEGGEIALGQNVTESPYMPGRAYNYEDAHPGPVASPSRTTFYTSCISRKYEIESPPDQSWALKRSPGKSQRWLRRASPPRMENGHLPVGAYVESATSLLSRVTPKVNPSKPPEEKLLRAIFGEKSPVMFVTTP